MSQYKIEITNQKFERLTLLLLNTKDKRYAKSNYLSQFEESVQRALEYKQKYELLEATRENRIDLVGCGRKTNN